MYSRNIVIAILACAALVSAAAVIRASNYLSTDRLTASVAGQAAEALSIDQGFFSTQVVATGTDAIGQAAESLPKSDSEVKTRNIDQITAEAYLVGDISTGRIYLEKNSSKRLPFASMSKLVTAIAATDRYSLTDMVEISTTSAEVAPDTSMLYAGEKLTVEELLRPLLVSSSNIAAEALASATGERIAFLEAMSAYAWEIGMPDSYFADPSGLSPRNAGTAMGFFALARYLYEKRPDILEITRTPLLQIATTTDHGAHTVASTHPFVNDPRFMGGKTGRTPEALETMLTIMSIRDYPIAIIVLRSDWVRAEDTRLLIEKVEKMLD